MTPGGPTTPRIERPAGDVAEEDQRELVLARVTVDADQIELPTPQVPVRYHVQVRNNHAIVQVRDEPEDAGALRSWADELDPDSVLERNTEEACHLWLHFRPVPDRWRELLTRFDLRQIVLGPEGRAEVNLLGTRADIESFVDERADSVVEVVQVRRDSDRLVVDDLTVRQEQAIRTALDAGYYEVPRKISLTDLAAKLDLSPSSLSELLRRAERTILGQHLQTAFEG